MNGSSLFTSCILHATRPHSLSCPRSLCTCMCVDLIGPRLVESPVRFLLSCVSLVKQLHCAQPLTSVCHHYLTLPHLTGPSLGLVFPALSLHLAWSACSKGSETAEAGEELGFDDIPLTVPVPSQRVSTLQFD